MPIFAILMPSAEFDGVVVNAVHPDSRHQVADGQWLIYARGTADSVSRLLGIWGGLCGPMVVFELCDAGGRHSQETWDWIDQHKEPTPVDAREYKNEVLTGDSRALRAEVVHLKTELHKAALLTRQSAEQSKDDIKNLKDDNKKLEYKLQNLQHKLRDNQAGFLPFKRHPGSVVGSFRSVHHIPLTEDDCLRSTGGRDQPLGFLCENDEQRSQINEVLDPPVKRRVLSFPRTRRYK